MDRKNPPSKDPAQVDSSSRLIATQQAVDEVTGFMKTNVIKAMERGENLTILDERADNLNTAANQFQKRAVKLQKKYWWENMKFKILIGCIIALVILAVILGIIFGIIGGGGGSDTTVAPHPPTTAP